jgi:hypothetical protein
MACQGIYKCNDWSKRAQNIYALADWLAADSIAAETGRR